MADVGHAKLGNSVIVHCCSFILGVVISIPKEPGNLAVQFREAFITFLVLEQNIDHASRERAESVTRYLSTVCLREALWASGRIILLPALVTSVRIMFWFYCPVRLWTLEQEIKKYKNDLRKLWKKVVTNNRFKFWKLGLKINTNNFFQFYCNIIEIQHWVSLRYAA